MSIKKLAAWSPQALRYDYIKQFLLFLMAMAIAASYLRISSPSGPEGVVADLSLHLIATVGVALVLYWVFTLFTAKNKNLGNTVITALLFYLVFQPTNLATQGFLPVLLPVLATTLAITQKFFIEVNRSPIINPVVFGALLAAGIAAILGGLWPSFGEALGLPFVSWWGAAFGATLPAWLGGVTFPFAIVSGVLVLLWMILGLPKWRKGHLVFAFLASHLILSVLRGEPASYLRFSFTDSTIYFFTVAMLIEPKTSPLRPGQQVAYGLFAAIVYNSLLIIGAPYFSLFAIAAANLAHAANQANKQRQAASVPPKSQASATLEPPAATVSEVSEE